MIPGITIAEISNPCAPYILQGRSFSESIKLAAKHGFQCVELQLRAPEDIGAETVQCSEDYGVKIVSIATGLACKEGMTLSAEHEGSRLSAIARIKEQIDFAASFKDRPDIMIGLMVGARNQMSPAEYYTRLGDSFSQLSAYAADKNIRINLEPLNHYDNNMLNTWEETVDFLDKYNCSSIKIGLDLYHMRMEEKNILQTIAQYGDRIGCVQMMDDNRYEPGAGLFDFSKVAYAVKKSGFDGPIVMECLPAEDIHAQLDRCIEFYNTYYGRSM